MTEQHCTVFFLHGLGFGAEAAAPIVAALGNQFRVIGINLPGHGGAPDAANGSVNTMADAALAAIEAQADGSPWLLLAHSMGGKIAAVVAARVLSGSAQVFGLAGAVLLAPSPPTPEPIDDDRRARMLSWTQNGPLSEHYAREFVAANVALPLSEDAQRQAITQLRQTSPLAWQRWLREGSREDVASTVGTLELPITVLAGEDDEDLGAAAQPQLLRGVYPRARFVSLAATKHLLPYERPHEVATEIARFWNSIASASPPMTREWGRLIASARTPIETRALLARRAITDDAKYVPRALSPRQLAMLRALADLLVPQRGVQHIDLAARVDAYLASGRGDGWRPTGLPDDGAACKLGLDTLASVWPDDVAEQRTLIQRVIAGEHATDFPWSKDDLRCWFEDLRNDLTHAWLAHPASLARVGYDGFATSAHDIDPAGYVNLGAGVRDLWEPAELGRLA